MPKLDMNFGEVPNEFQPVPPGTYVCEIVGAPQIAENSAKNGHKMVVVLKVISDTKGDVAQAGRSVQDHISTKMKTRIKRVAASAGVIKMKKDGSSVGGEQGLDTEELAGRQVTCQLTNESYVDKKTNESQIATRVHDYIVVYTD